MKWSLFTTHPSMDTTCSIKFVCYLRTCLRHQRRHNGRCPPTLKLLWFLCKRRDPNNRRSYLGISKSKHIEAKPFFKCTYWKWTSMDLPLTSRCCTNRKSTLWSGWQNWPTVSPKLGHAIQSPSRCWSWREVNWEQYNTWLSLQSLSSHIFTSEEVFNFKETSTSSTALPFPHWVNLPLGTEPSHSWYQLMARWQRLGLALGIEALLREVLWLKVALEDLKFNLRRGERHWVW